jgi:hypothetical protein
MKTSIKAFICALTLVSTAFTAQADDKEMKKPAGFGTGIYTTKSGKINLNVDKPSANAATTIVLRNNKNEILYRETVAKDHQKFGRLLNVDGLSAGKYEIQITSKGETQSRTFEVYEKAFDKVITLK